MRMKLSLSPNDGLVIESKGLFAFSLENGDFKDCKCDFFLTFLIQSPINPVLRNRYVGRNRGSFLATIVGNTAKSRKIQLPA